MHCGNALEQLRGGFSTAGTLRIERRPRAFQRVEQRAGAHPLGDREGQLEVAVLRVLQQTPGQPVVVKVQVENSSALPSESSCRLRSVFDRSMAASESWMACDGVSSAN